MKDKDKLSRVIEIEFDKSTAYEYGAYPEEAITEEEARESHYGVDENEVAQNE